MAIAALCRRTLLSGCIQKSFITPLKQWRYLSIGHQSIREILQRPITDAENGVTVSATGWVRTVQKHKSHVFLHVSDGSSSQHLQIVCESDLFEKSQANYGCSVIVEGILTKSPADNQALEIEAKSVRVLGDCDPHQYPFKARKKHRLDYVREHLHLRPRTNYFGALLRMRNAASIAVHEYFQNMGYCFVHTPILTSSDCEGAGEVFKVVTLEESVNKKEENNQKQFFNQDTFLTVSGQLHLEAISGAFRKSYSFGPTFRAEKSTGKLHLSEFYMIEAELAFTDRGVDDLIDAIQDLVKYVTKQLYDKHGDEVEFFEKSMPSDYKEAIRKLATDNYQKVSYAEAVNLLLKNNINFNSPISWGSDLRKDHEKFLVRHFDNSPVFVYDFPRELKPFYARTNEDGWTVAAVDLLVPGVGELVGGSIREERYCVLQQRLKELRMEQQYEWYLDLRKFGTVQHGGFGLGFERYLQCLLGIESIKDAVPFPRFYGSCKETWNQLRLNSPYEWLFVVSDHPHEIFLARKVPDATATFSFLVVENFDEIPRIPAKERDEIVLPNILKLHSIKVVEGGLLGHEQTCIECTPSELCAVCNTAPPTTAIEEEDDEEEDGERVDDEEQQNASDEENEMDNADNATGNTNVGYAVWARYLRTWYPAKVVSPDDIPPSLKRKLQTSEGLIAVKWYGEDMYSLVPRVQTDILAQNRIDECRAQASSSTTTSEQMLIKYNMALSDIHND